MIIVALTAVIAFSGCTDAPKGYGLNPDMADNIPGQATLSCEDYAKIKVDNQGNEVTGGPPLSIINDAKCANEINARKAAITGVATATSGAGDALSGAPGSGSGVKYDLDGKGIILTTPDGIDWSNPNIWYKFDDKAPIRALAVKRDGSNISILYVPGNGLDGSKTNLNLGEFSNQYEVTFELHTSNSKLLGTSGVPPKAIKTASYNGVNEIRLEGYVDVIELGSGGLSAGIHLYTGPADAITVLVPITSIAKDLGLKSYPGDGTRR